MYEDKHQNRHLRIIYTRLLERGVSKCVSYLLKEEHDDKEKFLAFIENIAKPIQKAQKVPLDNSYYNGLEQLMESIIHLKDKTFDFEETRRNILRTANGLKKIQRERNRKKEKHKKKKFNDGY
jgi:hypothetical protein